MQTTTQKTTQERGVIDPRTHHPEIIVLLADIDQVLAEYDAAYPSK